MTTKKAATKPTAEEARQILAEDQSRREQGFAKELNELMQKWGVTVVPQIVIKAQ